MSIFQMRVKKKVYVHRLSAPQFPTKSTFCSFEKKAKNIFKVWFLWKSFSILFNVNFFMLFQCMKCALNRCTEKPLKECFILTKLFESTKLNGRKQSICIILQLSDPRVLSLGFYGSVYIEMFINIAWYLY